jgi:hypothetical protein
LWRNIIIKKLLYYWKNLIDGGLVNAFNLKFWYIFFNKVEFETKMINCHGMLFKIGKKNLKCFCYIWEFNLWKWLHQLHHFILFFFNCINNLYSLYLIIFNIFEDEISLNIIDMHVQKVKYYRIDGILVTKSPHQLAKF